jgi:hypothetical protein
MSITILVEVVRHLRKKRIERAMAGEAASA